MLKALFKNFAYFSIKYAFIKTYKKKEYRLVYGKSG